MKRTLVLIIPLLLLLTACNSSAAGGILQTPTPTPETQTTQTSMNPDNMDMTNPEEIDATAQKMVHLSKTRLADKLGIAEAEISLLAVTPATWPDSSLGCPVNGGIYTQGITPGLVILLETQGRTFTFHTDMENNAILCDVRSPDEIYLPP